MRLPGKERSRRTGARDPDNCRQRKTELSRGQKLQKTRERERERGNTNTRARRVSLPQ